MRRPWTAEEKAQQAEIMRVRNADPEFKARLRVRARAQMKALRNDPEFVRRCTAGSKESIERLNSDPSFVAERVAAYKAARAADPSFDLPRLAALKQKHSDPEFIAKISAQGRKNMNALRSRQGFQEQARARSSAVMTSLHQNPDFASRHAIWVSRTMKRLHSNKAFTRKLAILNRRENKDRRGKCPSRSKVTVQDLAPLMNLRSSQTGSPE